MTIPQIFLMGYALAFILGGIVAWVYRGIEINNLHHWHNRAQHYAANWAMEAATRRLLERKISRLTNPPRDKSTGRFK